MGTAPESTLVAMNDEITEKGPAKTDHHDGDYSLDHGLDINDLEDGYHRSRRESNTQTSSARASSSTYAASSDSEGDREVHGSVGSNDSLLLQSIIIILNMRSAADSVYVRPPLLDLTQKYQCTL